MRAASRTLRLGRRAARPARGFMALSEDHQAVRDAARQFAEEELFPHAGETDRLHRFPGDAVASMAELGFMGMMVEERLGGGDLDAVSYAVALEEVSRGCASAGVIMSVNNSLYCAPVRASCAGAARKS